MGSRTWYSAHAAYWAAAAVVEAGKGGPRVEASPSKNAERTRIAASDSRVG